MVIEGFKMQFTGQELQTLLLARAKHHLERAAQKEEELPKLKAAVEAIKAAKEAAKASPTPDNTYNANYVHSFNTTGDPVEAMKGQISNHKNKAQKFGFYAKHLVTDGTYLLHEHELLSLELVHP
jgi:hypothetical protein